jgi:branched-chain amino acid transport system substrate-binding protein
MKKTMGRAGLLLLILMVGLIAVVAIGCGSSSTSTTAATAATTASTSASSSTTSSVATTATTVASTTTTPASTATTAAATETLKIGMVLWKGWPVGVELANTVDVMVTMANDAGGVDIGGKKYKIEVVTYDSDNNQDTAVTAMNRLVFQDKVKYVFNDSTGIEALVPIAEKNKVVLIAMGVAPALFSPENQYTFSGDGLWTGSDGILAWVRATYPDKTKVALTFTDDQMGHMSAQAAAASWPAEGFAVVGTEFFPSGQTDMSAVATRVMSSNPDIVYPSGSGPSAVADITKAVYGRGFKGLFVLAGASAASTLSAFIPNDALSQCVGYAYDTEFDPALTPEAQAFKDAWVKKNGKWTDPEVFGTQFFSLLTTAMQKAGSTEPDAIVAAIHGGLEWQSPAGKLRMISAQPGGTVTNVAILGYAVKKIVDGKPVLLDTVSMDQMVKSYYDFIAPAVKP